MEPTFKEKEENGIYTALLRIVTIRGVTLESKLEMDMKAFQNKETERLLNLELDLGTINKRLETYTQQKKANAIADLYEDFNMKVLHHKG